ncbi:right-handed parallel beta-helix repeat-containing protein [Methylocaldum sp.]|uniref:right-handed parallel beta-helix repeat-containing protein n=1 Tax=Methylocaldum sp. TaxID=1969727 RepID=UPI002D38B1FB|nr:right-handed parallel beta-helix repeat-containing protein [Methylocaldum sp.]HYE35373.1 right-handed parallel beta-helix repeat-containing protein [Methylocaldum sp.]
MVAFIFSATLHRYLLVFAALLALAAESAEATILTVGAIDGNGAACTLADAITAANTNTTTGGCPAGSADDTVELTGDVILTEALPVVMSDCRYYPAPCVQTRITINGHGHSIARSIDPNTPVFDLLSLLVICGDGFYAVPPSVTLNGVALKHGQTGISLRSRTTGLECPPSLVLTNSRVSGNSGDGISARLASVHVTNSTIADNGGRGINGYAADIDVTDGTIANNADRGILALGGNVFERSGRLSVTNSTLVGNTGGGIEFASLRATLVNSTVSGNGNATATGGGIHQTPSNYEQMARLTLTNTTVSNNVAELGGGFYHDARKNVWYDNVNAIWHADETTLINSIIADNTGGDCVSSTTSPPIAFVGQNLIEDGSCFDASHPNPPLIGDPKLGPLQDNGGPTLTHALLEGSLALDRIAVVYDVKGNPLGCEGTTDGVTLGVVTDQRGVSRPRPRDGFCDIGAFELALLPSDKDECKNGGYKEFGFKNLGQCIRYVNTGK